jgi:hypothetical protein
MLQEFALLELTDAECRESHFASTVAQHSEVYGDAHIASGAGGISSAPLVS